MRKRLLPLTILLCCFSFVCDGFEFSGYAGGMMVHGGYVSAGSVTFRSPSGTATDVSMKGVPVGIGGALKVGFGKHLRVGGEGYVSTLKYGSYGSSETIGWGGLLADCVWTGGRWSWFVGGTVGGGSVKNVTLLSEMPSDFILEDGSSSYREYGFLALVPFAGVEYAVTERIHLTAKVDWMFNASNPQPDFVKGPRLYIGFMFCHSK